MIALEQRRGKGENDSTLLRRARGRYVLLLNKDAELEPGATMALHERSTRAGGRRGGRHAGDPRRRAGALRLALPGPLSALLTVLWLHRRFVVQSRGSDVRRRRLGASAALLVRRDAAEAVGYLDPAFFVYSDEVDFCKRLRDAGWDVLYVPSARAVAHDAPLDDEETPDRRALPQSRPLHAQAPRPPPRVPCAG